MTLLGLHGCASIIDNNTREIVIDTPDGVMIPVVMNIDNRKYNIGLPAKLDVERSVKKKINLQFETPCGNTITQELPREFAPMVFANGIGVFGYVIDTYTGAASRYQTHSLVRVQNEQACDDADSMVQLNRASKMLSMDHVPPSGDGWKVGGLIVASIGAFITARDSVNNSSFDIFGSMFDEDKDKKVTVNLGPLFGGLLIGGGMYAYGIKQSSEYRQWNKKHFGDIANIGILVNSDSGVRLHYQSAFK